jgi:PAS domain S-box-containing protein
MKSTTSKTLLRGGEAERVQTYLATLVASSQDPIITTTGKGTVVSWNPAARKLYGWTVREIKGKSISQLFAPEDRKEVQRILAKVRHGVDIRQFESVGVGKDGQRHNVSLNISSVQGRDGAVTGVITIVRDITRRLRGTETRVRQNRELLTYHRLSQIVLSSQSLQDSYRAIADEIRAATGFPIAAIAIIDDIRQTVVFHGLKGRRTRSDHPVLELPVSKTLSGHIIQTGKPLITMHVQDHPEYRSKMMRRTRAQTFVGYPMRVGQKVVGCLNLAHTENVEISNDTEQWIEGLANYVAVLTERKRDEEELRTSREQLRELSRQTQSAIEEERRRIAREIHDQLGQELSLLQLEMGLIQDGLPKAEQDLRDKAKSMTSLIDNAIRSVQKISTELRPTVLDNLGLGAAVDWAAREFQKRTKTRCRVSIEPPDLKVEQERSTALFRILQETFTNILRHARASKVEVRLEKLQDAVVLNVRDNGIGIPLYCITDAKSVGLTGMRERVHPWGGSVAISGKPGKGTKVIATIPLNP